MPGLPCYSVEPAAISGEVIGFLAYSLARATFDRKSYCTVCGKPSENLVHCGEPTRFSSGIRFVDNHWVNVIATVFGALGSIGLFLLLQ